MRDCDPPKHVGNWAWQSWQKKTLPFHHHPLHAAFTLALHIQAEGERVLRVSRTS
jgi:hypothetical protein